MGISLIWNIFFILALSQGLFVGLVLLSQYLRQQLQSHLFLSLFILVFSYILLYNLTYWNNLLGEYPLLLFTNINVRFLLSPLFYLYFKSFTKRSILLKDFIHFLPFVLITYYFAPLLFQSGGEKLSTLQIADSVTRGNFIGMVELTSWIYSIQLLAYPIYIFSHLNKQFQKTKLKLNQIAWLRFLTALFLIYGVLMITYFIMIYWGVGGIEKDFYISCIMCISVYAISYVAMINPSLLKGEDFLEKIPILKYEKTKLADKHLKDIILKINALMEKETPYLDSDYNLNQLSANLNISRHHISQALNLVLQKSFNEYINTHRINHAKILLQQKLKYQNIKTVMYESGFNNRVSFNNNFKKLTGFTATEYLKQNSIQSN